MRMGVPLWSESQRCRGGQGGGRGAGRDRLLSELRMYAPRKISSKLIRVSEPSLISWRLCKVQGVPFLNWEMRKLRI